VSQEKMDAALYHAVQDNSLQVHYQPIVSLHSGTISGFEVLARWHCQGEDIPPGRFIPIAEQSGLIFPVGEYILETACRQLQQWRTEGLASQQHFISVNLSDRQLSQAGFVHCVSRILQHNALAGGNLHLEITASTALQDPRAIAANLRLLKQQGIVCTIDNLRNDTVSAATLRRLSIDMLKIDRHLLKPEQTTADATGPRMLQTIITLAHHLGIAVIAEGVEDENRLQQLLSTSCEYAQGYYFSPPVDATAAGKILAGAPQWERVLH